MNLSRPFATRVIRIAVTAIMLALLTPLHLSAQDQAGNAEPARLVVFEMFAIPST